MARPTFLHAMAAALSLLFMSLVFVGSASAHAVLRESTPAKDAAVAAPLKEVVLTFSEPLTLAVVQILDQDGHEVKSVGKMRNDGKTVHLPLSAPLPEGHYTVTYRVTGADTHVVTGSVPFVVVAGVR